MVSPQTMANVRGKSVEETRRALAEVRGELASLRAQAAASDLKNVRSIRQLRRTAARLNTYLQSLTLEP